MIDPARYRELFRTEAGDLLLTLERELLRLEEDGPRAAGAAEEAFRALHTLKGMAATLELDAFAALAHVLEDALEPLRSPGGRAAPALPELALEAVDVLRSGLREGGELAFAARAAALGERLAPTAAPERAGIPEPAGPRGGGEPRPPVRPEDAGPPRHAESLRISRRLLDRVLNEAGELVVLTQRLETMGALADDAELREAARRAARLAGELQGEVLAARMVPLERVFERFPRALRDHARRAGKAVRLVTRGGDIPMDRAILDGLAEPLLHLLRNAVDHGIEPPTERVARGKPAGGTVRLAAWRAGPGVALEVSDDGRGLDARRLREAALALGVASGERLERMSDDEVHRLATTSGLSTAEAVSATSGRGVGLDAVQAAVTRLGGSLSIHSAEGSGAAFTLHLPLTLAVVRALLVEDGGRRYAVALGSVAETQRIAEAGFAAPAPLSRLLGAARSSEPPAGGPPREPRLVVLEDAGERLPVRVDAVLGTRELVVRSLPPLRAALPFHGVTVLGDGTLAPLLDAARLVARERAPRAAVAGAPA